jgi:hypothetical protein
MMIGCDLLKELGILLDFSKHVIKWETDQIPMKEPGALTCFDNLLEDYLSANDPASIISEMNRFLYTRMPG